MYREMDMRFWIEKPKADAEALAWCEPRPRGRDQKPRSPAV